MVLIYWVLFMLSMASSIGSMYQLSELSRKHGGLWIDSHNEIREPAPMEVKSAIFVITTFVVMIISITLAGLSMAYIMNIGKSLR